MEFPSEVRGPLFATHTFPLFETIGSVVAFGEHDSTGLRNRVRWSLDVSDKRTLYSKETDFAIVNFTFKARTVTLLAEQPHRRSSDVVGSLPEKIRTIHLSRTKKVLISDTSGHYVKLLPGESCVTVTSDSPILVVNYVDKNDGVGKMIVTKIPPCTFGGEKYPPVNPVPTSYVNTGVVEALFSADTELTRSWVGFLFTDNHANGIDEVADNLHAYGNLFGKIIIDEQVKPHSDVDCEGKNLWHSRQRGDMLRNLVIVNHHN